MTTTTAADDLFAVREVYWAALEVSQPRTEDLTAFLRGLTNTGNPDEVVAVAEMEAAGALAYLRVVSGLVLTADEWLDGPFLAIGDHLDRSTALALIGRCAAFAGGLRQPLDDLLRHADRLSIIAGYGQIVLGSVATLAVLHHRDPQDLLAELRAGSDVRLTGAVGSGDAH